MNAAGSVPARRLVIIRRHPVRRFSVERKGVSVLRSPIAPVSRLRGVVGVEDSSSTKSFSCSSSVSSASSSRFRVENESAEHAATNANATTVHAAPTSHAKYAGY